MGQLFPVREHELGVVELYAKCTLDNRLKVLFYRSASRTTCTFCCIRDVSCRGSTVASEPIASVAKVTHVPVVRLADNTEKCSESANAAGISRQMLLKRDFRCATLR